MLNIKKHMPYSQSSLFLRFSWELRKAYKKIFDEFRNKEKLSQNEIDVLLFLKNNAPLDTAKDIATYRAMSKSMISRSVDSLYKRDYISYEVDELDKRSIHLKIEPKAKPIIDNLTSIQKEFYSKLAKNITKEEYRTVEVVLNKMYENIIDESKD